MSSPSPSLRPSRRHVTDFACDTSGLPSGDRRLPPFMVGDGVHPCIIAESHATGQIGFPFSSKEEFREKSTTPCRPTATVGNAPREPRRTRGRPASSHRPAGGQVSEDNGGPRSWRGALALAARAPPVVVR